MKQTTWHWPDHVIGKRESRRLREEHNALANSHAELMRALERIAAQCANTAKTFPNAPGRGDTVANERTARAALIKAMEVGHDS